MRRPSSWILFCLATLALADCSGSTPPPCGSQGEPCCNGVVCNGGLACLSNSCAVPGGGGGGGGGSSGTAAGSGSSSSSNSGGPATTSRGGSSSGATGSTPACGGVSQACCAGGSCNGGLVCQAGSCTQPSSGVAGTPCNKNSDCPTGLCLPVGQPPGGQPAGESVWTGNVCTTTCGTAAACIAGWSCAPLAGQSGDVCQCQYSKEICDGKDNDCNGIVDDEPAVDQACADSMGPGTTCQDGSCVCGAGTVLCGDSCSNTQTDGANCGGCAGQGGAVCPAFSSCDAGSCSCLPPTIPCTADAECCNGSNCNKNLAGTASMCSVSSADLCGQCVTDADCAADNVCVFDQVGGGVSSGATFCAPLCSLPGVQGDISCPTGTVQNSGHNDANGTNETCVCYPSAGCG